MSTPTTFDKFVSLLTAGSTGRHVVELRAFDTPQDYGQPATMAGFFDLTDPDHVEKLRNVCKLYAGLPPDRRPPGVFVTLNPVNDALLGRACARVVRAGKRGVCAGDGDALRRTVFYVDVDPQRPSGVAATDREKVAAQDVADKVVEHLTDLGFPAPVVLDSGNGYQLWFRIGLPADDGGLVGRFLSKLAVEFNTPDVKIDVQVGKAGQLGRVPETWNAKGDDIPDRPHRKVKLACVPEVWNPVPRELLERVAGPAVPRNNPPPANGKFEHRLKVPEFLSARGIDFRHKDKSGPRGEDVYVLDACPFNPDHKAPDAVVMQAPDGQLGFACMHVSCAGRGWQAFRDAVGKPDPDHYDPPRNAKPLPRAEDGKAPVVIQQVPPAATPTSRFTFIDSEEFLAADYRQSFLVDGILVADEPLVVAGPSKALKTSITVDLGVSLAAGVPFLGTFAVPAPVRVAVVSGESGKATLQGTANRVIRAKGLDPKRVFERLKWCFDLPRFTDPKSMADFADRLLDMRVRVVFIDPVYLCVGGNVDHANLFEMGDAFRAVAEVLLKNGVTPGLVHHASRRLTVGEPMQITHLAYSGLEQFGRQFLMLNRKTEYRGDGNHELWVSAGGSAGHGGMWSVSVEEGLADRNLQGRRWEVSVQTPVEADTDAKQVREKRKADNARQKLVADEGRILDALREAKEPLTKTGLTEKTGFRDSTRNAVIARLLEAGVITEVTFDKSTNNGAVLKNQTGYRMVIS